MFGYDLAGRESGRGMRGWDDPCLEAEGGCAECKFRVRVACTIADGGCWCFVHDFQGLLGGEVWGMVLLGV
jgi:hypothetical protein